METVLQAIASSTPEIMIGVVGFLLARLIKGVDKSVGQLGADVKSLTTTDTEIKVHLAKLDVRLAEVEAKLKGFDFATPRRRVRRQRKAKYDHE